MVTRFTNGRNFFLIILVTLLNIVSFSEISAQDTVIPLWKDSIPNYRDIGEKETTEFFNGVFLLRYVQHPDIAVFKPSGTMNKHRAVVICPGGGYHVLAYELEGTDIAKALNAKGITAVVLKYRLPGTPSSIVRYKSPLLDAQRALRMVRYYAPEWGVDRTKIGIMGFSAGGHLASTLSTHFDDGNKESADSVEQMSCRPNFSVLMYPVISLDDKITHAGSKEALIGKQPTKELTDYFSNEKQITDSTPPAILIHASDDDAVPVENSIIYYKGLISHGVQAEMHLYTSGKHGFGLALDKKDDLSGWIDIVTGWIKYITTDE